MVNDPIADMLTRVRNALMRGKAEVSIPSSKIKIEIARILKQEGYIEDYTVTDNFPQEIVLTLKYYGPRRQRRAVITGLKRVSKPGRRVYVGKKEIPWVLSGMGISILTTNQGVMTGQEARRRGTGGEVLCYIY